MQAIFAISQAHATLLQMCVLWQRVAAAEAVQLA
jgi:hypothetical protein